MCQPTFSTGSDMLDNDSHCRGKYSEKNPSAMAVANVSRKEKPKSFFFSQRIAFFNQRRIEPAQIPCCRNRILDTSLLREELGHLPELVIPRRDQFFDRQAL